MLHQCKLFHPLTPAQAHIVLPRTFWLDQPKEASSEASSWKLCVLLSESIASYASAHIDEMTVAQLEKFHPLLQDEVRAIACARAMRLGQTAMALFSSSLTSYYMYAYLRASPHVLVGGRSFSQSICR